jgi:aminoglycoside phosphotransferase (APT) family kinase protein
VVDFETLLDKPGAVRAEEAFDANALRAYLAPVLGTSLLNLQVQQYLGGFSNLTYLLQSGEEKWVLRRPPIGNKVISAHDMRREFRILSALQGHYPYSPKPLHFCADHGVLGSDFYLMSCTEGIVIRNQYPEIMHLSALQVHQQFRNLLDGLGELHALDPQALGLENFGRPDGYIRRQVEGWGVRYRNAFTPDAPNFDRVMTWLHDRIPPESGRVCIIHNDYKLDNVVWSVRDPMRLCGVLDWEMATLGDPLMDLGCTLAYWVEETDPDFYRRYRSMPSDTPGAPRRTEIVARFAQNTGLSVERIDFYYCFGLFRLAVIAQQIYYRYSQGLTQDVRFGALIDKAHGLRRMCSVIMDRSEL